MFGNAIITGDTGKFSVTLRKKLTVRADIRTIPINRTHNIT